MNDQSSHAISIRPHRGGRTPARRIAAACTVALALSTAALVARQPQGASPVTDKQRKNLAKLAEPWPDAAAMAKRRADAENRALFQSLEPLEFTLTADFTTVQRDRDPESTILHPATLTIAGADGQPVTFDVQIRNRGTMRRNRRTCDFPPLRIEIPKDGRDELKGSAFDGIKEIKLSTHCRNGYEQYVFREYLAYRTYNLITPWSLRARLASGTYVDAASGKTIATKPAFFIERDEDLAKRMDGRVAELPRTRLADHDVDALTRAAIFSFLIGSTDYSIFALHNAILVQTEDKILHTVVYDFDVTGLVSPPYAMPARMFHLDSVKDRLYRGPCRPPEELEPMLETFRSQKDAILQLYASQPELDRDSQEHLTSYVEEFFDIINDRRRTKWRLVDTCSKEVW